MIGEEIIDRVLDKYEQDPKRFSEYREEFLQKYVELTALLTADSMSILDDNEYDILWFVSTTIYAAIKEAGMLPLTISATAVETAEEMNWGKLSEVKDFRERVTPLFEDYPEEDLLAFVEDTIISDEEENDLSISETGKDVVFVTSKTIIDTMLFDIK